VVVKWFSNSYNRLVKGRKLHEWKLAVTEAREVQNRLAARVQRTGRVIAPRFIAGVDVSASRVGEVGTAAVVVLGYPGLELVEVRVIQGEVELPYMPGLLSFREAPLILRACEQLSTTPDIIVVDGQGIAHPRRFGLASHLGLLLNKPTVGCAKSRLCGSHDTPGNERGSTAELLDGEESIGAVVRTKQGTKPLYISVGHRIELQDAVHWVMECCRGYRLPEPVRLAHQAAGGNLKW
jgi:deoxyribonuclease V